MVDVSRAHGGIDAGELGRLGIDARSVLDLSVNVNPYGPCPAVRRAIAEAAIDGYPDRSATPARRALARWTGVAPERVIVGNGAVEILWLLARATLRRGSRVLVVEPAFSEMRAAAVRAGAEIFEYRARPEDDFRLDLDGLAARIGETRPSLLYLCTPSNPAGRCTPLGDIEALAAAHPEVRFVVDISFLSMSTRHAEAPRSTQVAWVRSLTKDHALAGLRVGFGVVPLEMAALLEAERPPWSVNALAQAAAIAATTEEAARFLDDTRARWLADRARLDDALRHLELRAHPSDTVYSLVDLGPRARASELRATLLARHRVLVRDASSFGLPRHIRIGARPAGELDRLVTALRTELSKP